MKNLVEIDGSVAKVKMSHGFVTLVDKADLELIADYRWYAHKRPRWKTHYVLANDYSRKTMLQLHTLLVPYSDGLVVDHKNRNGLDNRRCNLRRCTQAQNHANGPKYRNNTSGYKGVVWVGRANKYAAGISLNGKRKHLGYFVDPIDAAVAYNKAAFESWGEFAYLNDVNQNTNQIKEQG